VKKLLLAGVAVLSVLSASAAHASFKQTCAVVSPPIDTDGSPGRLNVRQKPNTKSQIYTTVTAGDVLLIDTDPTGDLFEDWISMYGTMSMDGEEHRGPRGWVSKKYIILTECPEYSSAVHAPWPKWLYK
jgi:hypothetical protein